MTPTRFSSISATQRTAAVLRLPQLGQYSTTRIFRWNEPGERGDGVLIEPSSTSQKWGSSNTLLTPCSLKDEPGPVRLSVEKTEVTWHDYEIGMTQIRLDQEAVERRAPEFRDANLAPVPARG